MLCPVPAKIVVNEKLIELVSNNFFQPTVLGRLRSRQIWQHSNVVETLIAPCSFIAIVPQFGLDEWTVVKSILIEMKHFQGDKITSIPSPWVKVSYVWSNLLGQKFFHRLRPCPTSGNACLNKQQHSRCNTAHNINVSVVPSLHLRASRLTRPNMLL